MGEIKKIGVLGEHEISELKRIYKDVFTIKVPFEDESGEIVELYGYVKKPERYVMGMALAIIESNPVKSKEIILEKSWLAGDERIKTNDDAFYSASVVLDELFVIRRAELKKN